MTCQRCGSRAVTILHDEMKCLCCGEGADPQPEAPVVVDSPTVRHYRARRAAGQCIRCPNPAMTGFVHCLEHHAAALVDGRRNERRRKDAGLCGKCLGDAVPGKSLCPRHLEAARASSERRRREQAIVRLATSIKAAA